MRLTPLLPGLLPLLLIAACGGGDPTAGVDATGSDPIVEKAPATAAGIANAQPVFRFAKLSNGAYFYTGSVAEKDQILAGFADFRCEGVAFHRTSDGSGLPVYRFANLRNGGYFYTASTAERDFVQQTRPDLRYEGSTFSVSGPVAGAQPVYRLANLRNGAYLYTVSTQERAYAAALGEWRDEGEVFRATPVPANLQTPPGGWCAAPSVSDDPLAKYVGHYSGCDGHERQLTSISLAGDRRLSMSVRFNIHSGSNCSGSVVGTYEGPEPVTAEWTSTGYSNVMLVAGGPYRSLLIDRVTASTPAQMATLYGSGVQGLCVSYTGGRTCYDSLFNPAASVSAGLYLTTVNGQPTLYTLRAQGSSFIADTTVSVRLP